MSVIILLVIAGIIVAGGFLLVFIWAVRNGQYDDLYSPSVRILFDEPKPDTTPETPTKKITEIINTSEIKSINKPD
jgi:cbb3-type cytochrome oxidase maturation protein